MGLLAWGDSGEVEMGRYRQGAGKALRFTALRRARYLEMLEATGNRAAAAEAIRFYPERMSRMRRRDPAFAADCARAEAAATRRLLGARGPFEGVEDGEFQTIRRGRDGRAQIIAVGPGRWSKRIEDRFLEVLAQCGNIEASARSVGFAGTDMFRRRRQWPAFAGRMEEALEDAEVRLEFRLACWASPVPRQEEAVAGEMGAVIADETGTAGDADETGTVTSNRPRAQPRAGEIPFDPDFALKFLKWREEKRRGGGQRGRARKGPPQRTFQEAIDSVLGKVAAIERHENARRLEEGWSRDEEGRMIPPGWVRAP